MPPPRNLKNILKARHQPQQQRPPNGITMNLTGPVTIHQHTYIQPQNHPNQQYRPIYFHQPYPQQYPYMRPMTPRFTEYPKIPEKTPPPFNDYSQVVKKTPPTKTKTPKIFKKTMTIPPTKTPKIFEKTTPTKTPEIFAPHTKTTESKAPARKVLISQTPEKKPSPPDYGDYVRGEAELTVAINTVNTPRTRCAMKPLKKKKKINEKTSVAESLGERSRNNDGGDESFPIGRIEIHADMLDIF